MHSSKIAVELLESAAGHSYLLTGAGPSRMAGEDWPARNGQSVVESGLFSIRAVVRAQSMNKGNPRNDKDTLTTDCKGGGGAPAPKGGPLPV